MEKLVEAPLLAVGEAMRHKHEQDVQNPLVRRPFFVTVAYPADDDTSALALDAFLGRFSWEQLRPGGQLRLACVPAGVTLRVKWGLVCRRTFVTNTVR